MSINKLEITTKSKERFLLTRLEANHEPIKDGCVVVAMLNTDFVSEYVLACGIPLQPGEAGRESFNELRNEIKQLGLKCNIFVQGR